MKLPLDPRKFISPPPFPPAPTPAACRHGKNLNSDAWRKLQLWKATANPAHPFSRFATGNLETLITIPTGRGISVHER
jgi:hypothetical protein